jgi:hypothetical protein
MEASTMSENYAACATAVKVSLDFYRLIWKWKSDQLLSRYAARIAGDANGKKISRFHSTPPSERHIEKFS